MHPTDRPRIHAVHGQQRAHRPQAGPTAAVGGATMLHPRWLRPDVGQAPRERRDQHVVGAQACWRGRGATRARCRGREAARYWVLAGLGVIGARSQVASKTPTQCRSWVRISPGESRDGARTQMGAAQGYATAPIPCR